MEKKELDTQVKEPEITPEPTPDKKPETVGEQLEGAEQEQEIQKPEQVEEKTLEKDEELLRKVKRYKEGYVGSTQEAFRLKQELAELRQQLKTQPASNQANQEEETPEQRATRLIREGVKSALDEERTIEIQKTRKEKVEEINGAMLAFMDESDPHEFKAVESLLAGCYHREDPKTGEIYWVNPLDPLGPRVTNPQKAIENVRVSLKKQQGTNLPIRDKAKLERTSAASPQTTGGKDTDNEDYGLTPEQKEQAKWAGVSEKDWARAVQLNK